MSQALAQNKKAYHDYEIIETFEAGIVLTGTEIKSIRKGKVQLRDSYGKIKNAEVFIWNMHVAQYEQGNIFNHDETRTRKLLLHKKEIRQLISATKEQGYTLIPLKLYLKKGRAKVLLAIARGKKLYDKRETEKKRSAQREIAKVMKQKQYG